MSLEDMLLALLLGRCVGKLPSAAGLGWAAFRVFLTFWLLAFCIFGDFGRFQADLYSWLGFFFKKSPLSRF